MKGKRYGTEEKDFGSAKVDFASSDTAWRIQDARKRDPAAK